MLGPGDTYLVTPASELSACKYANGQILAPPVADEGLVRYIQKFTKDFLSGRVTVQIDSVIFDDGTLIGADDAGVLGRVNNRINAEKDLLNAIQPLNGKSLHDYLSATKNPELKDEYFLHRASRAQELQELLDAHGEAEFKNELNSRRYGHWFNGNDFVAREGNK